MEFNHKDKDENVIILKDLELCDFRDSMMLVRDLGMEGKLSVFPEINNDYLEFAEMILRILREDAIKNGIWEK